MPEYKVSIIVQGEDRASGPLNRAGSALGGIGKIAGGILAAGLIRDIGQDIINIGKDALDSVSYFERLGISLQSLVARELVNNSAVEKSTQVSRQATAAEIDRRNWLLKEIQTQEKHVASLANGSDAALKAQKSLEKMRHEVAALGIDQNGYITTVSKSTQDTLSMADAFNMAKDRAAELMGWITQVAIKSPFTQKDISDTFRQALAYGFTTKEAQNLTQATVDFAAGSGASSDAMSRIGLALGQIKARGHLAGQEVLQLVNAGLPVTQILAKAFHVTTAQLQDMQSAGLIPADKAIKAITDSLEHDFGGAAEKQATTFAGLVSSLSDIKTVGLDKFFSGVFEAAKPFMVEIVDKLSSPEFMARLEKLGKEVGAFLQPIFDHGIEVLHFFEGMHSSMDLVTAAGQWLHGILLDLFGSAGMAQIQLSITSLRAGFDNLSLFWTQQGPIIMALVNNFGQWIGIIFSWVANTVIKWLIEKFNEITSWVQVNGPLIQNFIATFSSAMVHIIGVVTNMWQFVKPILDGLIKIILDVAKFIMQVATQDWPGAWNTIQQIVTDAWTAIKGFFTGFVNWVLQTFVGTNLKEFTDQWKKNFELLKTIAQEVIGKVQGFFEGLKSVISKVVGSVVSLIEHIGQIHFPTLPSWAIRHSPSPIEQTFGNWAAYAKDVKDTMGSIYFPSMGNMSLQHAMTPTNNSRQFNLYLSTTQSPAVVQQSFDLMRVLDAA